MKEFEIKILCKEEDFDSSWKFTVSIIDVNAEVETTNSTEMSKKMYDIHVLGWNVISLEQFKREYVMQCMQKHLSFKTEYLFK